MSDPVGAPLRVSVIVPAWNDHVSLTHLLPALVRLKGLHEVIVADASPHSATAESARTVGVIYVAAPQPNRGAQMNLAAENATGDVLIFHHADSVLTAAHVAAIRRALRDPETIGGAFYRKFDGRHPRLRWLEVAGRFFTRQGGSFFGDQSIFVRRGTFRALGGFAPIPLMEDMEFSQRLRRAGRVAVLDPPVESSARRHASGGAWRTSLQNGLFIVLYKCGLSPRYLHRWYYRTDDWGTDKNAIPARILPRRSRLTTQLPTRNWSRNSAGVAAARRACRVPSSRSSRASAPTQIK